MKSLRLIVLLVCSLASYTALAADGLISLESPYSVKATMDRLQSVVKKAGMKVFARINHSAGAAKIGKKLRPTELLIFGNPKGGTPFMECAQTVGIDLPVKALVWKDEAGKVWLGYNDPAYIAKRHGVPDCKAAVGMGKALDKLTHKAIAK